MVLQAVGKKETERSRKRRDREGISREWISYAENNKIDEVEAVVMQIRQKMGR